MSLLVTVVWWVGVSVAGNWDRVATHWASGATMLFGSFLAGSSVEAGGAVAFPVTTKLLHIPSPGSLFWVESTDS